ncbi:hypothetical protein ACIRN4_17485 [Pimelobacter simplex]|uniref:Uncharacterized protein n=1 Tax=Nocardioides simplex TaxID=2045 RepID=A0A0C5XLY0_NOCSI|nr:hypothetical protein [Pimelobacter simplex]AJR18422.1 hypothetical protein KR76_00099 [Pimelobacter simplex]MCG8149904.1 hypothetical protein [Pimelobacter simplex]GEB13888.1 hypothetical protein NSI01_22030 [Pimelobacter simplex]SFM66882.1 hypothetical protein SAMN05421671_2784 [Pimelobacter simplex]
MSLALILTLVAVLVVAALAVGALFGVVYWAGRSSSRAQVRQTGRTTHPV